MKFHLVRDPKKNGLLTYRTLETIAGHYGLDLNTPPAEADCFLVSVDDVDDLPLVRRARKIAKDKPLIGGGFEAFAGEYLLNFCDGMNVGEGYEFFEEAGHTRSVDALLTLPYVLTRGKNKVHPSEKIDQSLLPLVHTTPKHYYYLAGRGCKGKCAFCMTGFVYPGWHNSEENLSDAYDYTKARKMGIPFVTNDSAPIMRMNTAQSVRVRDYLADPKRYKAKFLHFGIEGFSESRRKWFGKPISDDEIQELMATLTRMRQPSEFFFIVGFPGAFEEAMEFARRVPISLSFHPKIFIKLTMFEPSPHSPLWTYPIGKIEDFTPQQYKDFQNELHSRSMQFTLFPQRGFAKCLYRALSSTSSTEDFAAMPKIPVTTDPAYFDGLRASHPHLFEYDGRPMPNSQIISPWRKTRDKFAALLGMKPVNYKCDL